MIIKPANETIELYGDGIGRVQYIQHYGSDKMICASARVSFGQDELEKKLLKKDIKLINYLMKHKHTSPFEACGATFKFVVPLFIRSQHHRSRVWSFNEISRRYTSFNLEFFEPIEFRKQDENNRQASVQGSEFNPELGDYSQRTAADLIKSHHEMSLNLYNALIDANVCRELARGVLPQNMYTQYYGTANLNNLFKFIDLRSHKGAQLEINKVAEAILKFLEELFPEATKAYKKIWKP